jgi:hypothetical protein
LEALHSYTPREILIDAGVHPTTKVSRSESLLEALIESVWMLHELKAQQRGGALDYRSPADVVAAVRELKALLEGNNYTRFNWWTFNAARQASFASLCDSVRARLVYIMGILFRAGQLWGFDNTQLAALAEFIAGESTNETWPGLGISALLPKLAARAEIEQQTRATVTEAQAVVSADYRTRSNEEAATPITTAKEAKRAAVLLALQRDNNLTNEAAGSPVGVPPSTVRRWRKKWERQFPQLGNSKSTREGTRRARSA